MKTLLLLSFIGFAFGGISQECIDCICQMEGCESQVGKCKQDVGSTACGPYQIHYSYWNEGGHPDGDYETCTKQFDCSQRTIRNYMDHYGKGCRNGRPTCEDYMRMHNGGPSACKPGSKQYKKTNGYWSQAQEKCGF
jgi:hypothetical protein